MTQDIDNYNVFQDTRKKRKLTVFFDLTRAFYKVWKTDFWEMETMANIQPVETRRNFKMQCKAEKAKRLLFQPLHYKPNQPFKSRLQRKRLQPRSQRARKERRLPELPPRVWLPIQKFEVSTKISGIHSKADHPVHMLKALTLETLDHKYPKCSCFHIFTDGSAARAVKMEEAE